MKPSDLLAWRKRHSWTQQEAADALGMAKGAYVAYERGEREGKPRDIPRWLGLACAAIALGVRDWPATE